MNETFSSNPNEGWRSSPEDWNREPVIKRKQKNVNKKLVCVLRVDIDGQRSEDLKLY